MSLEANIDGPFRPAETPVLTAAALAGLDVVWVGVRCSADVAEERERVRGDRFRGLARSQTATVHRDATYDFEIDTTTQSPSEALSELTRRLGY